MSILALPYPPTINHYYVRSRFGGDTAAKKQIGNAVPPVLAEALYKAILAA